MLFVVVYLLSPINVEASYWISASSRIIVGLFFCAVSVYCLVLKKHTASSVAQFIAMFLYEQIAVVSFAANAIIIMRHKQYRQFLMLAINVTVFVLYYGLFVEITNERADISREIINFNTVKQALTPWLYTRLYTTGFTRGNAMAGWYYIPIIILSILAAFVEQTEKVSIKMLLVGLWLFVAPQLPLLMLANNHISFRTCAPSLAGIAVIVDNLSNVLGKAKLTVTLCLTIVFMVVCVSELFDYRENYLYDRQIVDYVATNLDLGGKNAVIEAKDAYIEQNVFFVDHIKSVTSSDWALTGCVRQYFGDRTIPMIQINPRDTQDINLISLIDF
jgi:hypothetical protein